jgi:hypothetical protein
MYEAHGVPAGGHVLVLVQCGIALGIADPVGVLVSIPVFEENPAAVIVFLRQHAPADIEHAAPAGAGAGRRGGEAEQRHHRNVRKVAGLRQAARWRGDCREVLMVVDMKAPIGFACRDAAGRSRGRTMRVKAASSNMTGSRGQNLKFTPARAV